MVLPKIISPNQGAFMQTRQIINNITMVQETIHSSYANKEKGMIVKLDMAIAFDGARHSYIVLVLLEFGFSNEFVN